MAAAKRDNTPARWAVVIASGLAALGFWTGIINGPQPAQANSNSGANIAMARQSPSASPPFSSTGSSSAGSSGRRQLGSQTTPSQPSTAPTPRFRTRGS